MKIRPSVIAAAFGAAVLLHPSSATADAGNSMMPAVGARLDRSVHLEQDAVGSDGKSLPKGTYDLKIESLGKGNVKVSFFQGGVRKGETKGVIVMGETQATGRVGPGSPPSPIRGRAISFADLGLDGSSRAACFPPIGTIGPPGGNQIRINLPAPAARKVREAAAAPLR
jgi:hypothetical protein